MAPAAANYTDAEIRAIVKHGRSKSDSSETWNELGRAMGRTALALRLKWFKIKNLPEYAGTPGPMTEANGAAKPSGISKAKTPAKGKGKAASGRRAPRPTASATVTPAATGPAFTAINAPASSMTTPTLEDDDETVGGSATDEDAYERFPPVTYRPTLPSIRDVVPFTERQRQASAALHALNDRVDTLARLHFSQPEPKRKERPFKDVLEAAQGLLLLSQTHGPSAVRALDSGFDRIPDRRY